MPAKEAWALNLDAFVHVSGVAFVPEGGMASTPSSPYEGGILCANRSVHCISNDVLSTWFHSKPTKGSCFLHLLSKCNLPVFEDYIRNNSLQICQCLITLIWSNLNPAAPFSPLGTVCEGLSRIKSRQGEQGDWCQHQPCCQSNSSCVNSQCFRF